jgi:hypothetical protein
MIGSPKGMDVRIMQCYIRMVKIKCTELIIKGEVLRREGRSNKYYEYSEERNRKLIGHNSHYSCFILYIP